MREIWLVTEKEGDETYVLAGKKNGRSIIAETK